MDLVAEKLVQYMQRDEACLFEVQCHAPRFSRLATTLPFRFRYAHRFNVDRLLNRFIVYPRQVRRLSRQHDLFHVADHTYSALVHAISADRTGVYCHDLDAFRCLIDPEAEPRPWWFRKMAERILSGLQKAAVVFHSTLPVRDAILKHGLLDAAKLVHAPYGVAEEFSYTVDNGSRSQSNLSWLPGYDKRPWIAHVGSCIARKRIDLLLDIFSGLRKKIPELRLVKIGGDFSPEHQRQIESLGLQPWIVHRKGLERIELAEVYRRAGAVLITSDAEGFGLPVIEALACGAPVVASDIPVLRESGGNGANFAPVADIDAWVERVFTVLSAGKSGESTNIETADRLNSGVAKVPSLEARLAWAARFTWVEHARIIAGAYEKLL